MNQLQEALYDLQVARKRDKRFRQHGSTGEHEIQDPWAQAIEKTGRTDFGDLADRYRQVIDQHLGYGAGVIIDQYVTMRIAADKKKQDRTYLETAMELWAMLGQLKTKDGEWVRPRLIPTRTWIWRFLRYGRDADLRFAERECRSKYEREPYSFNALLVRAKMARYGSATAAAGLAANVVISAAALIAGVDWFLAALPYIIVITTSLAGLGEYCHERFHLHEPRFHLSDPEKYLTIIGNVSLSDDDETEEEVSAG